MAAPVDIPALSAALRALPTGDADSDALQRLGRRVRRAVAAGDLGKPIRIRIVSSFMVDMLADALAASLLRRGIVAELDLAPYGALPTGLIGQTSQPDCDLLMLLPTHRDLMQTPDLQADRDAAARAAEQEADFWAGFWPSDRPVVQLTFDPPAFRAAAEADGFTPGGTLNHVRAVNQRLAERAGSNVALVDAEALAMQVGRDWHSGRTYALCKQPFANEAMTEVSEALAAAVAGVTGRGRKVLVLDLDNTVWGGVIGDVGLEGLVLGMETAEGEAFVALQRYAQALSRRGVILAVCSKNNDAIARSAFGGHSGMVLQADDIACFMANFEDKATNIRRIAETLNVGLDSLVFVDDNPVERAWVKDQLPEVLVIDLPEDPAGYVEAIEKAHPFPLHRLTAEDVGRNRSYLARAKVAEAAGSAGDIDSFLAGLEPRATCAPLAPENADRVVQLIGKTNQFKLNPTTWAADALRADGVGVLALSLADRMQDYGIVAVAVTRAEGSDLIVEQWVMSCRVFSRRLEHAMLELLGRSAAEHGCARIVLPFTPSAKNGVARDFLTALGFVEADGGRLVIYVDTPPTAPHHMTITDWRRP
jgi:FkbH-like protein